jgi:hypothetical protein
MIDIRDVRGTDIVFVNPKTDERVSFAISGFGSTRQERERCETFREEHSNWKEHKESF